MPNKKKKIIVNIEEKENVDGVNIKKSSRSQSLEKHQDNVSNHINEFYNNQKFSSMDRPHNKGLGWGGVLVIAIIFGLIAGFTSTVFILQHRKIEFPFGIKIDIGEFSSNQGQKVIEEKNITITSEEYLINLSTELQNKIVRIFPAKIVSGQVSLSFLEQIYAPWQTLGLGVILSPDGWLMTTVELNKGKDYIALDKNNKIFAIEQIVSDPFSKVNFLKIAGQDLPVVDLAKTKEALPGTTVVIFDKFRNLYLTEISNPIATTVYKTEDLVRSTDRFSDCLRLNKEISISSFPNGLLFNAKGSLLGLVSIDRIIPAWHLPNCLNHILQNGEIKRLYLGIDYVKIEEAPGLLNKYFKDLSYGLIVYGPPLSGSPADKAGIKNADVIIKADGLILGPDQDLTYLIQEKFPGDQINLTVLRQGEEMEFNIILEEKLEKSEENET
ncbi:hypothetical protein B6D52_01780 [Candidatus Parcubacteria bacterium 4484_255]|nr:MAG: hypothetical protein B6D52_01780 [Candidatus Parcubacteria bacterium 4484_255]